MADQPRERSAANVPTTLAEVRASIDEADVRIVGLLAERRQKALQAARFKSAADGVKDAAREEQVISHVRALADQAGIEPDLVETLYRDMIAGFVRVEQATGGHQAPLEVENSNVAAFDAMLPPEEMKQRVRLSERARQSVVAGRRAVEAILDRRDPRCFAVVGPCSIHDPVAGLDYARRLKALADEVSDTLLLVMRVYFEKPRTSLGWEGFTNDPHLDGSFRIKEGMERARRFMVDVAELGLPIGTEALDPIAPHYRGDLVAWTAIGARTSESQTHRNLASGLSTPVAFKNGTDGSVTSAVNAIVSAAQPAGRLVRNLLERRGLAYDEISAVLSVDVWNFADVADRAVALSQARRQMDFRSLILASKRIRNIVGDERPGAPSSPRSTSSTSSSRSTSASSTGPSARRSSCWCTSSWAATSCGD